MAASLDSDADALARFGLVTGPEGEELLERLAGLAPELGRYIVEFGYGEVYSRPGLELRERQIAAVAALVAQGGAEPQLRTHVGGALRNGLSRAEVVEVIVQCLPFVGFPRVLNAVGVAGEVFDEIDRGTAPSEVPPRLSAVLVR